MGNQIQKKIKDAISTRYIYADQVVNVLSMAIASGINVLLWGPPGQAKSEMVQEALKAVTTPVEIFTMSFGEGLDEATLFGGIDFKRLNKDDIMEFDVSRSFMSKEYAVFEEIFDAPPRVLCSLKDTLQAGEMRKGAQTYKMRNKVVIGITNLDPAHIADLGPSQKALIERFPLQLRVNWPHYKEGDYAALYKAQGINYPDYLPTACAAAGVSPRTAIYAYKAIKAYADMTGKDMNDMDVIKSLVFVEGFEDQLTNMLDDIERSALNKKNQQEYQKSCDAFNKIMKTEVTSMTVAANKIAKLKKISQELKNKKFGDEYIDSVRQVEGQIGAEIQNCTQWIIDNAT